MALELWLIAAFLHGSAHATQDAWRQHQEAAELQMRYADIDDPVSAVAHLEQAMAGAKREGASAAEVAHLYDRLASAYLGARQLDKAERTLDEARRYVRAALGEESPALVPILQQLGDLRYEQKRNHEMLELYAAALNLRLKSFGPASPDAVEGYGRLGAAFHSTGNLAEAEKFFRRSLEALAKVQNPSDELVGNTTMVAADFLGSIGKTAEAEALREQGSPAMERFLAKEREDTKTRNIDALRRTVPPQD